MNNKITFDREDGEAITVEIILSFEIEELNKKYIAYTLNSDCESRCTIEKTSLSLGHLTAAG